MAPPEIAALKLNFTWTNEWAGHIHTVFQVSRSTGSLLVCCKMLQKCSFLHLFVHGSYKTCSVEVKFFMDKLGWVDYMHTKFQVSMSTESLLVCCKILRKCNFLHHCVHGSYKNCSIEMKFHIDELGWVGYVHSKFQVSRSMRSLLVCRTIL